MLYLYLKMGLLKKYSFLKYVLLCLLCLSVHRAEGRLFQNESERQQIENGLSFSAPEQELMVPRQTSLTNTLRTFSQAGRSHSAGQSRIGTAITKGSKFVTQYSTVIYQLSLERFSSGLSENHHRLISLGKLII